MLDENYTDEDRLTTTHSESLHSELLRSESLRLESLSVASLPGETSRYAALPLTQLSILEIFYVTSFVAAAFAVYLHCSELLAFTAGGCIIVVAIVRAFAFENAIFNGIFAFVVAMALAVVIAVVAPPRNFDGLFLFFLPPFGYFYGFAAAAFHDHSL